MRSFLIGLSALCCVASAAAEEAPPAPSTTASPAPPGPVAAASPAPAPAPAAAPAAAEAGPKIKLGGQLRLRPEFRDRLKPDALGGTNDGFVGQRARASVAVATERLKAYVEVQDARNWGTEASTTSNERNADLHQAYLQLPDVLTSGFSLTLGRQELAYGDERLIGALDWATNARSFDGGLARYAWRSGSVDGFGALVNDRKTAARGVGDMWLSGLYARLLRGKPGRELDLYALNQGDGTKVAGELVGLDASRVTTLGARARYAPRAGLQASAEGAFQTGHRGPDAHEAYAFAVSGGYVFGARFKPSLRVEYDQATGDADAKDGKAKEFLNLYPTNHAHYGYIDVLGWRNMEAVRATAAVAPRDGQLLSVDFHVLKLKESRGAWKDAGGEPLGQDPTGAAGRDLGSELDLLYRFPLRKELTVLLGYSAFFPGRFAGTVRGRGTQSFGYAQLLFKF